MAERITVESTIAAEMPKVWEYYTLPEHITEWNFATDDWRCPGAENDLRPGGKYKARMEAKDGSFGFDFEAVYDEVEPGKFLSYTMGDGRKASVQFDGQGASTLVKVSFDAESQNDVAMQRAGWQAILNNFKKYTEAN